MRDRDAALETIADREQTIVKFRHLVQQLQEQSLDLQHRLEKETSKPVSALPEIMDFKKMFTETKAHIKAIDLELRRVDIQQLQQHIKYLTSYMPESFMNRGGNCFTNIFSYKTHCMSISPSIFTFIDNFTSQNLKRTTGFIDFVVFFIR